MLTKNGKDEWVGLVWVFGWVGGWVLGTVSGNPDINEPKKPKHHRGKYE